MDADPVTIKPNNPVDHPLSAPSPDVKRSMGGNNAFYNHCEIYGGMNNYAVCLHTIDCVRDERMTLRSACVPAIQAGTCPALKMRKEEHDKGHSIYFYDRAEQIQANEARMAATQATTSYRYGRGNSGKGIASTFVPTDPATLRDPDVKPEKPAKVANAPAPKAPIPNTEDLAGRNLLEEAINRTTKGP